MLAVAMGWQAAGARHVWAPVPPGTKDGVLRKQPWLPRLSEPAASGEGARHGWGASSRCLPIRALPASSTGKAEYC